jgi:chemotaxis protein histidine kinase CheA
MTVAEAALKWNVNRRTVLKWMLGKDGTGRGKRLEEGRDFEKVETPRGPVWFLLTDRYPMPSLAPIQREKGIPRKSRAPAEPVDVFETQVEERALPAEQEEASEATALETRAKPKRVRTTRKAAARAESIPEASDTDTETAVERRAKRTRPVREADEEFDRDEEEQVEVPKPRKAPAKKRAKADSRAPTRDEVEEDVERALEEEPMSEEERADYEVEQWLQSKGLPTDGSPVGGSLAIMVASSLDTPVSLLRGPREQTYIERAFERKLAPDMSTPARQRLVGAVLDYLVRMKILQPASDAYYPPKYSLRGISDDEVPPTEMELRGLGW